MLDDAVKFQYISCCYLSLSSDADNADSFKFQYISCCYLSYQLVLLVKMIIRFNTSHVVIYPFDEMMEKTGKTVSIHLMLLFIAECPTLKIIQLNSFNTSHVVIYRAKNRLKNWRFLVSIHLMLLFI